MLIGTSFELRQRPSARFIVLEPEGVPVHVIFQRIKTWKASKDPDYAVKKAVSSTCTRSLTGKWCQSPATRR
jgi:hypothetical protein